MFCKIALDCSAESGGRDFRNEDVVESGIKQAAE
jgi:hypothetical protein